jgi:predicted house-cleaning noncanonical NTP pyrophosphatase (MazG superfamily)
MKNEKIYNKLVRDKIPEVIERTGKKVSSHIAGELEYKEELFKKVYEELEEFKENPSAEEMADIFEVLEGLIKAYNIEMNDVFDIKEEKVRERGAFDERIILERVWEE